MRVNIVTLLLSYFLHLFSFLVYLSLFFWCKLTTETRWYIMLFFIKIWPFFKKEGYAIIIFYHVFWSSIEIRLNLELLFLGHENLLQWICDCIIHPFHQLIHIINLLLYEWKAVRYMIVIRKLHWFLWDNISNNCTRLWFLSINQIITLAFGSF